MVREGEWRGEGERIHQKEQDSWLLVKPSPLLSPGCRGRQEGGSARYHFEGGIERYERGGGDTKPAVVSLLRNPGRNGVAVDAAFDAPHAAGPLPILTLLGPFRRCLWLLFSRNFPLLNGLTCRCVVSGTVYSTLGVLDLCLPVDLLQ